MNGAGVVWIFALMFLICADITGRTLFDRPLQSVPEILALSLISCVFLQLAFAASLGRLTRDEILLGYLQRQHPVEALSFERLFALIGAAAY